MAGVKGLIPAPIRALRWRLPWLRAAQAAGGVPAAAFWRAARFTLAELGGDVRFSTPDGLQFTSMANNFSSFALCVAGARDPDIWRFITRRVGAGATFVDAGANIGAYSVPAARLVGPTGRVVAFEAHPATFRYLAKNIALNRLDWATPLNLALGAGPGTVSMAYNVANPGETHVRADGGEGFVVRVTALDAWLAEAAIGKVDYLKIDVEGFELPVLQGARDTIAASPDIAVQTEMEERHAERYGHDLSPIVALLSGLGLSPHHIQPDGTAAAVAGPPRGDVIWFRR
jgi:FkbM family methyltransferase